MHDLTHYSLLAFFHYLTGYQKKNFLLLQPNFVLCTQDSQAPNIQTEKDKYPRKHTQQSYDFKPLNHARIKSGKVENIPSSLGRVWWWLRWDERRRQRHSLMDGPPTTWYSTDNGWRRSAEISVYSVGFVPPQDRVFSQEISISQCFSFVFFWKLFWKLECKKKV